MNALDKAFLRAYTKDHAAESARIAASTAKAPAAKISQPYSLKSATITIPVQGVTDKIHETRPTFGETPDSEPAIEIAADETASLPDDREQYFADGTWIRVEQSSSRGSSTIPAPHVFFATTELSEQSLAEAAKTQFIDSFAPPILKKPAEVPQTRVDAATDHALPKPHWRRGPLRDEKSLGISKTIAPSHDSSATSKTVSSISVKETNPIAAPHIAVAESPATDLPEAREALISATKATKSKLPAVWEVDRFLWSDYCERALSPECDYFREAGIELHKATRNGLNVLSVTSSQRGEGRTMISLCLARAVAATGIRVALVDADLDNPQLATSLGIEPSCGWEDVVRGELPLDEAAVYSHDDRITLMPLSDDLEKRNYSLSDPRVTKTINQLKEHFDLVIIDMGPMGAADRRLFAGGELCPIDAALVVRDVRLTATEEAFTTAARLKANGVRSVGIVENFV